MTDESKHTIQVEGSFSCLESPVHPNTVHTWLFVLHHASWEIIQVINKIDQCSFQEIHQDHFHLQLQRLFLWTELEQWNGQSLCSCSVPMSSNALYNKNIYSHSLHHHWEVSSLVLLNHQNDTLTCLKDVRLQACSHSLPPPLPRIAPFISNL